MLLSKCLTGQGVCAVIAYAHERVNPIARAGVFMHHARPIVSGRRRIYLGACPISYLCTRSYFYFIFPSRLPSGPDFLMQLFPESESDSEERDCYYRRWVSRLMATVATGLTIPSSSRSLVVGAWHFVIAFTKLMSPSSLV